MKGKAFSFVTVFTVCLLLVLQPLLAIHPEVYFGFYSYKDNDVSIEFVLHECGLSDLKIDGKVTEGNIEAEEFGRWGTTAFLRIGAKENPSQHTTIQVLIQVNVTKVEMVSGIFLDANLPLPNSDSLFFTPNRIKAIQMNFNRLTKDQMNKHLNRCVG